MDSEVDGYQIVRLIDVIVSLVILILMLPLIVPLSLALVFTNGLPVFFGHERQSKGGRVPKCWKFGR